MSSSFGVHSLCQGENRSTYFLKRPFGNYLIFGDKLESFDREMIDQSGGLFKVFLSDFSSINSIHSKLFKRYGCSIVIDGIKEKFSKLSPIERYARDYSDPALDLLAFTEAKIIFVTQQKKKIAIFSNELFLTSKKCITHNSKDVSQRIYDILKQREVEIAFFCSHETGGALVLKRSFFFSNLLKNFTAK